LSEPVVFSISRDDRRTKPALVLDVGHERERIDPKTIGHAGKLGRVNVSLRAVRMKESHGDGNRVERSFHRRNVWVWRFSS
jgi:hypothetical protein